MRTFPLVVFVFAVHAVGAVGAAPPPKDLPAPAPEDPYLWLEDLRSERALAWVAERNTESRAELTADPGFAALQARILGLYGPEAGIPYPNKLGPHAYNFWKGPGHPRGLWRRTSWAGYGGKDPEWETVIDLDALAVAEKEDWVWEGADCLAPGYSRCLLTLRHDGAGTGVIREFDVETRGFVKGGFSLPTDPGHAAWIDQDHVLVGTDWGQGTLTNSGNPRELRRWRRGTPLASADLLFAGETDDIVVTGWVDRTAGVPQIGIERVMSAESRRLWWLRDGVPIPITKPDDAVATTMPGWLLLELRSPLTEGGRSFAAGSLLATRLDAQLGGVRRYEILFGPWEGRSISAVVPTRNHVILLTLDPTGSRSEVLTPCTEGWTRSPLAGLPGHGNVSLWAADPDHDDEILFTSHDLGTPLTLSSVQLDGGVPKVLKQAPAAFDGTGLTLTRHEATSEDGTKIPYLLVLREGLAFDGKAPTLLYGDGGFGVQILPGYDGVVGAAWLERGGAYAIANIRGGGEFGPAWHEAAKRENRPRAEQDFAAVARDLIARKVTDREHLGLIGYGNGGLLVGNMMVGHPDLFRAAVASGPLLDMRRYPRLSAGAAAWKEEYGDPDQPEQWAFIQRFSPYHRVRPDGQYPRVLIITSTSDRVVHPGHARKMVARLSEFGKDILYFEELDAGRDGAAEDRQSARHWALIYTFLWRELR